MTPSELETYLHDHIPLTLAMQVRVLSVEPGAVVLGAPLAPNINHRETVFGGSACALAILAAWSLVHVRLAADGLAPRLVIQRNTMDYDLPIEGDFTARSSLAPGVDWARFTRMLARKGLARIALRSVLSFEGRLAGRFEGEFVALASSVATGAGQPERQA
jgi:thioesterase domain-containing protein